MSRERLAAHGRMRKGPQNRCAHTISLTHTPTHIHIFTHHAYTLTHTPAHAHTFTYHTPMYWHIILFTNIHSQHARAYTRSRPHSSASTSHPQRNLTLVCPGVNQFTTPEWLQQSVPCDPKIQGPFSLVETPICSQAPGSPHELLPSENLLNEQGRGSRRQTPAF